MPRYRSLKALSSYALPHKCVHHSRLRPSLGRKITKKDEKENLYCDQRRKKKKEIKHEEFQVHLPDIGWLTVFNIGSFAWFEYLPESVGVLRLQIGLQDCGKSNKSFVIKIN
jgi:hypothetical protein